MSRSRKKQILRRQCCLGAGGDAREGGEGGEDGEYGEGVEVVSGEDVDDCEVGQDG